MPKKRMLPVFASLYSIPHFTLCRPRGAAKRRTQNKTASIATALLLGSDLGELDIIVLGPCLQVSLASSKRTRETMCGLDSVDTVDQVEVLLEDDLVASGRALAGDDRGVGKEVFPDLQGTDMSAMRKCDETKEGKPTRNHRLPYLASTLSLLAIQLRYHLQRVAE